MKLKTCLGSSSNFSIFTSQPRSKVPLVFEYAADKFGGIWPGPTSHLGTGGFLYPSVKPSV